MKGIKTIPVAAALVLVVAGCSSVPRAERAAQRKADYEAVAGPDQHSFRYFSQLWSWEPLGNDLLVVYARPNQAWLLTLAACFDLDTATAIGLTSRMGEVSVGFDKVLTGRDDMPCTITRIRPVDVAHLKARQARQREIEDAPRPVKGDGPRP